MKIFKRRADLSPYLAQLKADGNKIGFVPTMGALHEGHISLIQTSLKTCDITICSIFVNPTQFNNPDDLKNYPRPVEKDIEMLLEAGCDILYLPEITDIYPAGIAPKVRYKPGYLGKILEGASRKGHFEGVMQVVAILLEITKPTQLFLGQKDYQQFLILSNLIKQLKFEIQVVCCPIIREKTGLAMSSRNVRLSPVLRKKAALIYHTLVETNKLIRTAKPDLLTKRAIRAINSNKDFKVDYFKLLDANTLKPVTSILAGKKYILITSVIAGGVRLLDNLLVGEQDK